MKILPIILLLLIVPVSDASLWAAKVGNSYQFNDATLTWSASKPCVWVGFAPSPNSGGMQGPDDALWAILPTSVSPPHLERYNGVEWENKTGLITYPESINAFGSWFVVSDNEIW